MEVLEVTEINTHKADKVSFQRNEEIYRGVDGRTGRILIANESETDADSNSSEGRVQIEIAGALSATIKSGDAVVRNLGKGAISVVAIPVDNDNAGQAEGRTLVYVAWFT